MKNKQTFEEWLEEYFVGLGEVGGMSITKDNCENMFDSWSSQLDVQEVIDLAQKWHDSLTEK